MTDEDRHEVADLIYCSLHQWYRAHGYPRAMQGGPEVAAVYHDVYNDLTPGCNVVVEHPRTRRLMGSCFYHPRAHHVSLGIMNVHPNYFGQGVASRLLRYILDYADRNGFAAVRLTQSACNVDSFSLYNKAGFVPRTAYQDMRIDVPAAGLSCRTPRDHEVRPATLADVPAMAALEMSLSGISREIDYRYCIENARGFWYSSVLECPDGGLDGFLLASGHPACLMLGPGVARSDEAAAALLLRGLNHFAGRAPVFLLPMDRQPLVRTAYEWGARNTEMHFCQVRGEYRPYRGVNIPTFLPETG
jgi:GNAT superfamily N-acetyltransferase